MKLGKFARNGIESELGPDVEAAVSTALFHYIRRLKSPKKPAGPPRFLLGMASNEEADVIELPLGPATEAALQQEALRHQIPVGEVLVHAVLTYLAERDVVAAGEAGFGEARRDVAAAGFGEATSEAPLV